MKRSPIKFSELRSLPVKTLEVLALAMAKDVDAGEDKRGILEVIMLAIGKAKAA
jgi:hypothetical protein